MLYAEGHHMYQFGCCAAGAENEVHNPQTLSNREALDVALAALTYRRAVRVADGAPKRMSERNRRRINWEVAQLDAAIRRVRAIRDLGVADEIETVTVTVPAPVSRTVPAHTRARVLGAVQVPHDPNNCAQCAEDEYTGAR